MTSQQPTSGAPSDDEFPLYNPNPHRAGEATDNPAQDGLVVPSTIGPQEIQSQQHNRSRRNLLFMAGVGAVGLAGAGWAFSRGAGGNRAGDIGLPGGVTQFKVEVQSGDVTIKATDGAAVGRWEGRTGGPDVGQSGDVATVAGDRADLTLELPAGSVVEIVARSGDVRIEGASLGALTITTASGDIRIERTTLDKLAATTTSGDVDVALTRAPSGVSVTTTSGDVELRLPGRGYRYETDTRSGDVDIPGNSGNVPVTVRTTSGGIDIDELR